MTIFYNCTGTRRKELVTAISEITGAKAEYQFMPTQAYQIDYFTVDKDGNLSFDDRADSEEIELLIEALYQRGFVAENQNLLTIELPEELFDETTFANLDRILDSSLVSLPARYRKSAECADDSAQHRNLNSSSFAIKRSCL